MNVDRYAIIVLLVIYEKLDWARLTACDKLINFAIVENKCE